MACGVTVEAGALASFVLKKKIKRLDVQLRGKPLDFPQREIALPTLDAADIRAVKTQHVGEGFLV